MLALAFYTNRFFHHLSTKTQIMGVAQTNISRATARRGHLPLCTHVYATYLEASSDFCYPTMRYISLRYLG